MQLQGSSGQEQVVLRALEADSIEIIREAAGCAAKAVLVYSTCKASSVLLHLARKAFYPGSPPFSLLRVDTPSESPETLDAGEFDLIVSDARRADGKSHASEPIFSVRSARHGRSAQSQRPELWNLYNTQLNKGESIQVFPLANWTDADIGHYIDQGRIPTVPLDEGNR